LDETFDVVAEEEREELLESVGGLSPADGFLDELMPPEFDWRGVARRHPLPALGVAALLGFWLGRSRRGAALAEAVVGAAAFAALTRLAPSATEPSAFDDDDGF
jgi:hypothetical protein